MANDNCCGVNGLPTPTNTGPYVPLDPCAMAQLVKICEPNPPVPFTVTGEDCAGAPLAVSDPKVVLTVPAPGAVQLVKFCTPTGSLDREFSTLCAPDGTKVLVVTAWDTTAPLAVPPVVETYTLAGAAYAGDRALLTDCAAEKLDIVSEEYCAGGFGYERISFYDVSTQPPALAATLWRDQSGAAVADPGTGFVGTCNEIEYDVEQYTESGCANGTPATRLTTTRFDRATGFVLGAPVVVAPTGFVLGACPPTVSVDRAICSNTNAGEVWNMVERTTTNSLGAVSVSYFDPDTSPMVDVSALFNSIRHGGACDCCNDILPPLRADLQILKTSAPAQVFVGDTLTYTITATNNGPDAADGATVFDAIPAGFTLSSTAFAYAGGAADATGAAPEFNIATFPAGGSVTITLVGEVVSGVLENTAVISGPEGVDSPSSNNTSTTTPTLCVWEEFHENLSPLSTLMGVYSTGTGVNTLGFVDVNTGALTPMGSVPGANLNALGLDKATNNAVFLDRNTGNIYTAYSPGYAIANPSVLQPGTVAAASAILGALDSNQDWWVGNISGSTGLVATLTVAKVDPQTGVQTAVPSLTATLNSGSNGFDFDFAPNDDLYALVGLNIYLATQASGYAGWTLVGALSGIAATGGSAGYDQGIIRGTSAAGQVWAFDISTGVTTVTANMPAGTAMADMAGAVDPVCKRFFRNSCTGAYYELNRVVEYTPSGTPIAGGC